MKSLLSNVFGFLLILCTLVFSIHFVALDSSFYTTRYEKMNLASSLSVSSEDLNASIETLLEYIQDQKESIDLKIVLQNQKQEAFNAKEKRHMVDVKALYQSVMKVAYLSLACMALIVFYFFKVDKRLCLSYLTLGFLRAALCFVVLIVFLGFWIVYDFTAFWNCFHELFFTNDLWLLNPATDFMICMLPEIIFHDLVLHISERVIFILVPICIFSFYYQFKKAPIGFER